MAAYMLAWKNKSLPHFDKQHPALGGNSEVLSPQIPALFAPWGYLSYFFSLSDKTVCLTITPVSLKGLKSLLENDSFMSCCSRLIGTFNHVFPVLCFYTSLDLK